MLINLDPSAYNLEQFKRHIVSHAMEHTNAAAWHVVRTGKAAGILVGGYLDNFLYLIELYLVKKITYLGYGEDRSMKLERRRL